MLGQFDQALIERKLGEIIHLRDEDSEKPITLFLSVVGGDAVAAIAFHNCVKLLKVNLRVVVVGEAYSAGIMVLCAGTSRAAWRGAKFFFHDLARSLSGPQTATHMALHGKILEEIEARDSLIISEITGNSITEVTDWKKQERMMDVEEAKTLGLIDEIL